MKGLMMIAAAVTILASPGHKDAYILSTGDNNTFNMGTSIPDFNAQMKRFSGRYIWVRRNGHEYLIRDETTILRAEALFAPEERLSPEQEAIGREERQLDKEADRLEDKDDRTAADERRLEDLHAKLRDVERREKELDEKQEALEREAERDFWSLVDSAIRSGAARPLTR
jgi:hypothetical protein